MIRPTVLLVFLMLSASLAGCIEEPIIDGVQYVTSFSTNGGNDFYAIMSGSDRVNKLIHITY